MATTYAFTLWCAGTENSLAGWGLDDLRFSDNDLAPSTVEFTAGGRAVDASDLFAYGSRVVIFQNRVNTDGVWSGGICWFDGRVEPWERDGTIGAEDCIGRLVNAWWYFEHIQYKMSYVLTYTGVGGALTKLTYYTNRVVLGCTLNPTGPGWLALNAGQQIAAAINYAISQGAPITLGVIAPWAPFPTDFQKCIKVAQVIQKMWQVESDFMCVWDYSTVGTNTSALATPTLHFKKANSTNLVAGLTGAQITMQTLTPVTINLDAGNWLSGFKCKPRPDWIKSYVHIDYDQMNTIGSEQYLSLGTDQCPAVLPGGAAVFNGVDLYFDLSGGKVTVATQTGNLTSAPFDITSLAKWEIWKAELTADNVSTTAPPVIITSASTPAATAEHPAPALITIEVDSSGNPVDYNEANAYELLDGAYADWMADATLMVSPLAPISAQKVRAIAWVFVTMQNGTQVYKQITKEFTAISFNTAFVAKTLTAQTKTPTAYAELQPVGLAQIMYNAWRSLAVEGSFAVTDTEIGASAPQITRQNCLNFTSAAIAAVAGTGVINDWSAVNAPVRRVSGSAVKGTYTVEFGAPLHLTANALIDIIRAARVRIPSVDLAYLFGGALNSGGGNVQHSRKSHAHAAEHGADEHHIFVVSAPDTTTGANNNVMRLDGTTGTLTVNEIVRATGAQDPTQPNVVLAPSDIRAILSDAGAISAAPGFAAGDWLNIKWREFAVCDSSNNKFFIILPTSGGYTKPA